MFNLPFARAARQPNWALALAAVAIASIALFQSAGAGEAARTVLPVPDSQAATAKEMKAYAERVEHTNGRIEMVPIPGGTFMMGSPAGETGRSEDEGPRHKVKIAPFWMGKYEITWDVYEVWMFDLDIQRRKLTGRPATPRDAAAEEYQISQPTEPYTDMTFGMGKRGYPAICMTQLAAKVFCKWLTEKTGRYYRLPTEAEWEYACRADTTTAYSFGNSHEPLADYAWYYDNSDEKYQKVGQKKPNPWGLYDMHGNVAEWVLDQHTTVFYGAAKDQIKENPLAIPSKIYPRVVRGGSWDSDPEELRSAARMKSDPKWKRQDPQFPKSIWYHTDATHVGFRIVRPLVEPTAAELQAKWDKSEPVEDRKGGR